MTKFTGGDIYFLIVGILFSWVLLKIKILHFIYSLSVYKFVNPTPGALRNEEDTRQGGTSNVALEA